MCITLYFRRRHKTKIMKKTRPNTCNWINIDHPPISSYVQSFISSNAWYPLIISAKYGEFWSFHFLSKRNKLTTKKNKEKNSCTSCMIYKLTWHKLWMNRLICIYGPLSVGWCNCECMKDMFFGLIGNFNEWKSSLVG